MTALEDALEVDEDDDDVRAVLKLRASGTLGLGPLNRMGFEPLGEDQTWTYYVLSTREARAMLRTVITEYGQLPDSVLKDVDWGRPKSWAGALDAIEGVELYGPEDRADRSLEELVFDPLTQVDVLIWPAGREATATARVAEIRGLVEAHAELLRDTQVRVVAADPRPDRTLVRIETDQELLDALLQHPDVEQIRAPLQTTVTRQRFTQFRAPKDMPDPADTVIGVVDGVVVTTNALVGPYLQDAKSFPTGHTYPGQDRHGTAVAGCAIWGDLDAVLAGPLPDPYPVVSARVLEPATGPHGDIRVRVVGLPHQTIEEAVRWLVDVHEVRVICVSIAYTEPATTALRNEFTLTLDQLARELDVVIVVAAGNRSAEPATGWLAGYPDYVYDSDAGVASPGDGAIVVTAGSIAQRETATDRNGAARVGIAGKYEPSPFTRTGPVRGTGRTGAMKPEFVHHGGNWAYDTVLDTLDTSNPGVSSIVAIPPQSGRVIGSNNGTSFAAPKIAREVARIAERYPDASANLLRALAALSARRAPNVHGQQPDRRVSAYGQPDADRVLESSAQRVFLTFEGWMNTNRTTLHRLPIPPAFADGISQKVFRVALAFDPPVRRQRREYVAGTMRAELVRGLSSESVQEIYSRQPTIAEAEDDPGATRLDLPDPEHRPNLQPGANALSSNTLIRRDFVDGSWDPDHNEYVLVVRHRHSPWTEAQKRAYDTQRYALVIEIADETRTDLDLYALIQARLSQRVRIASR